MTQKKLPSIFAERLSGAEFKADKVKNTRDEDSSSRVNYLNENKKVDLLSNKSYNIYYY
ncbi:MAG: hypothetical protein UR51_C0015G0032 [Candidatus Moranbacteria bacterium GW2011_GWF1_34_10]|nr:MAG: hypothetical protein UR51_C0015G0032 [Candidatus Moranbacteria bacterium GW2011_GWF1_34_10]